MSTPKWICWKCGEQVDEPIRGGNSEGVKVEICPYCFKEYTKE